MLKHNFGDRWVEAEFGEAEDGEEDNSWRVEDYLRNRPNLLALSSHTARLPPPRLERLVFPVLFLRHPLDRLFSAYAFERMQEADTHGAQLAKRRDFAGYVQELLADPRFRQARNFQTWRLADYLPPERGSERERAIQAVDSLPFVGLVEDYEGSLARLGGMLAPHCPGFRLLSAHENQTPGRRQTLAERIDALQARLPAALYDQLTVANSDDFAVYERASNRLRDGG